MADSRLQEVEGRVTGGYWYEADSPGPWTSSSDEDWDIVMLVKSEIVGAEYVGCRWIDGRQCSVYQLVDGRHVAHLKMG